MSLIEDVEKKLRSQFETVKLVSERPKLWYLNLFPVNIRTATKKSGDKYWFDVTADLYQRRQAQFLIDVCGTPDII